MRKVDQAVHEFAAQNHQLITREEFLRFGSVDQLKRRLGSGYLIRVHDSIYRLAGTLPTWRSQLLAACWAGGRLSAASFRAAAALMWLPGGLEILEITCRRHCRVEYPGVLAHESRFLTEDDLIIIDGIPVTRAARTLCDLAGLVELGELQHNVLDHALLEAMRRNLVDVGRVWREYERLGSGKRLGGDVIYDALQRFVPPVRNTETPCESEVLRMIREHDLPEPVPQYWLQLGNGEWVRLDFAWPERKASLEWDPYKWHGNREQYETMQSRTRLMRAMGWERVCATDDDFDAGMPESLAALDAIFRRL